MAQIVYRNTNPAFGDTSVTFTSNDVQSIIDDLCAGGNAADRADRMGITETEARGLIADEFRASLEQVA